MLSIFLVVVVILAGVILLDEPVQTMANPGQCEIKSEDIICG